MPLCYAFKTFTGIKLGFPFTVPEYWSNFILYIKTFKLLLKSCLVNELYMQCE